MNRILIVEDVSVVADRLKKNIQRLGYSCAGIASNLSDARTIIKNETPNLAILDIDLNGLESGLDLASELEKKNIPFIVLSDLKNKTVRDQVLKHPPAGYLIKPVTLDNLQSTIELALVSKNKNTATDSFHFKQPDGFIKLIDFDDIVYLKADNGGREIYYLESSVLNKDVDLETLSNFISSASSSFLQVNRSYIVNLKHIESYTYTEIKLKNVKDTKIPIGKTYRQRVNVLLESR